MDVTLDDVQDELREPRYTEHFRRGDDLPSLAEVSYRAWQMMDYRLQDKAALHFSGPNDVRCSCEASDALSAETFLVLGEEIIGHGLDLREAAEMALARGYKPNACLVVSTDDTTIF